MTVRYINLHNSCFLSSDIFLSIFVQNGRILRLRSVSLHADHLQAFVQDADRFLLAITFDSNIISHRTANESSIFEGAGATLATTFWSFCRIVFADMKFRAKFPEEPCLVAILVVDDHGGGREEPKQERDPTESDCVLVSELVCEADVDHADDQDGVLDQDQGEVAGGGQERVLDVRVFCSRFRVVDVHVNLFLYDLNCFKLFIQIANN